MVQRYTTKHTKIESGYMGQIVEWREVATESATLKECRMMLGDALRELILAHGELAMGIPQGNALFESVSAEV